MKGSLLLALVVALFLLVGGGAAVVVNLSAQQKVRAALRRAAKRFGVDPDIADALGYVESTWRLSATNMTGTDLARGGAFGPTQITEKTARGWGYQGPMSDLTTNLELAAEWTARGLAARPGGAPRTIADAAAWWNAGKASAAALPVGHVTRATYIPRAEKALAKVRAEPLPDGAA